MMNDEDGKRVDSPVAIQLFLCLVLYFQEKRTLSFCFVKFQKVFQGLQVLLENFESTNKNNAFFWI